MQAIVLHATLETAARWDWQPALLRALPYAKRLQLEGREVAARDAGLAGIALALLGARRLLSDTPLRRAGDMLFPLEGKPAFAGPPQFSISHSSVQACCGLSLDTALGIDTEYFDGTGDAAALQSLRHWTAIEATLKTAGRGLHHAEAVRVRLDLASSSLDGVSYALHPIELLPGSVCHLASTRPLRVQIQLVDLASPAVSALLQEGLGLGAQSS
jgi:hypothetical protein